MLKEKSRAKSQITFDEDFNVPDAKPDVGRLIQHKGRIVMEDVRLTDGKGILTGNLEVDVLYIKQIEQSYLPKLRKLLYLLAVSAPSTPNVSQLSKEINMSRATVMNYIKYLTDARLLNMLYPVGESFPKKPSTVYMYNSNLMYPVRPMAVNAQAVRETFFFNQLLKSNRLNEGVRNAHFLVNGKYNFRVEENVRVKNNPDLYYATEQLDGGEGNVIPLWLFGFLY